MRSILLFFIFLSILSIKAYSQQHIGTIKGTIKTADGSPAEFINVVLKGTNKGTTTNSNGEFEIKHATPGTHSLVISFIGLEPQELAVEVKAGEVTSVPEVTLNEDASHLTEVVVTGMRERSYQNESSNIGSKSTTPLKDIPQAISYVTKELVQDRQSFRIND
ncbi:MAG: carboxypeptidase-like regulatory domain-containing protein, partial [Bacteroidota bacterium]